MNDELILKIKNDLQKDVDELKDAYEKQLIKIEKMQLTIGIGVTVFSIGASLLLEAIMEKF